MQLLNVHCRPFLKMGDESPGLFSVISVAEKGSGRGREVKLWNSLASLGVGKRGPPALYLSTLLPRKLAN